MLTGNIIVYQLHSESNPVQMCNWLDIWFSQPQKRLFCFLDNFAVSPLEDLDASHYIYFISGTFRLPKEAKWPDVVRGQKPELPSSNIGSDTNWLCGLGSTDAIFPKWRQYYLRTTKRAARDNYYFTVFWKHRAAKLSTKQAMSRWGFQSFPLITMRQISLETVPSAEEKPVAKGRCMYKL